MSIVVGLDIGGTSVKLGAWRDGERLAWRDGLPVPATTDQAAICAALAGYIRELAAGLPGPPVATGVGSCGMISAGVIHESPNTVWDELHLVELLGAELDQPVTLINDADAFLLAALARLDNRAGVAVGITLGTGIGTAVWLTDRLLAGGAGISPEGGHITIQADGETGLTGIPGTWEHLAGRTALLGYYARHGGTARDPREMAAAADAQDPAALAAWREYGRMVGIGLGTLVNVFNPNWILIGGGLAGANRHYRAALTEALATHKLRTFPAPQLLFIDDAPDLVAAGAAIHAADDLRVGRV
ncbi:ROK family protein [bacterium]|nr:ROK family protein [bacterium]